MARRQSETSISLFPFLAVLVCTMGALILLLLVTTRRIRHQQTQAIVAAEDVEESVHQAVSARSSDSAPDTVLVVPSAAAVVPEPVVEPEPPVKTGPTAAEILQARNQQAELLAAIDQAKAEQQRLQQAVQTQQVRSAQLTRQVQEARSELQQLQNSGGSTDRVAAELQQLTSLRQQEGSLQQQLQQSQEQLQTLQEKLAEADQTTHQVEQILVSRESALTSLREHVRQQEAEPAVGSDQTIIEFSNSTGTAREPIIVEITADGLVFRPGQVQITPQDLQGFPARDNPLLSGILSVHRLRSDNSVISEPYVLLLVRPEGTTGFYVAQRILKDADVHFGYELLEADRQVAYGTPSDEEARVLRESLLAALTRRQALYAAMAGALPRHPGNSSSTDSDNAWLTETRDPAEASGRQGRDALEGRYYAGGHAPVRQPLPPKPLPRIRELPQRTADSGGSFRNARPRSDVPVQDENAFGSMFPPGTSETETVDDPAAVFGPEQPEDIVATESAGTYQDGVVSPDDVVGSSQYSDLNSPPAAASTNASAQEQMPAMDSETAAIRTDSPMPAGQPADEFWGNLTPIEAGDPATTAPFASDTESAAAAKAAADPQIVGSEPRRDSRPPSGWSDSSPAGEAQTTRTAGPAGIAGGLPNASAATGGSGPSSDFVLNAQPWPTGSSPSATAVQLDGLDPAVQRLLAGAAGAGRLPSVSRQEVTVFLDPGHITVAGQSPLAVPPEDFDEQLLATLQGISKELQHSPAFGTGQVVPVLRFIVSPGAERMHLRLARELSRLGIASASVIELSPHVEDDADATGNTVNRMWGLDRHTSPADSPAMPVIRAAEPDRSRRIRI